MFCIHVQQKSNTTDESRFFSLRSCQLAPLYPPHPAGSSNPPTSRWNRCIAIGLKKNYEVWSKLRLRTKASQWGVWKYPTTTSPAGSRNPLTSGRREEPVQQWPREISSWQMWSVVKSGWNISHFKKEFKKQRAIFLLATVCLRPLVGGTGGPKNILMANVREDLKSKLRDFQSLLWVEKYLASRQHYQYDIQVELGLA